MSKTFDFSEKFNEGKKHEATLDAFFGRFYDIVEVGRELERHGVDRIFRSHAKPVTDWTVEYKADSEAATTGNVFLEDVSVSTGRGYRARGWVLKTVAQAIVYYVPPTSVAYLLSTFELKQAYREWRKLYPARDSGLNTDGGYRSRGVLVPLGVINQIARGRFEVGGEADMAPFRYEELRQQGYSMVEAARLARNYKPTGTDGKD